MDTLTVVARVVLGSLFLIVAFNGLFDFLPMPAMPEAASAYIDAMKETGYAWPLLKVTEIVAGLLLLLGRFVPLALVVLAPIVVNILFFHVFLAPGGLVLGIALVILMLILARAYWPHFRSLFTSTEPA